MKEGMDIYYAYNEIFRFCVYVINGNLLFNKLWLWEVYPIEFLIRLISLFLWKFNI